MEVGTLVNLYRVNAPASSLTDTETQLELAWLLQKEWSTELVFFSLNFAGRYYQSQLEVSIVECLIKNREEIKQYYSLAKAKSAKLEVERKEGQYDKANTFKRADTPSWFRKSFDSNLFK